MNDFSDHELIRGCVVDGDKAVWETFIRKFSKLIWSSIHKTFRNYSFQYTQEDLDDMYGAIFLSLIENDCRKLKQFRSENSCSVSTWLSIISVRMTIDYMRKDKSRYIEEQKEVERDIWDIVPDLSSLADDLLEKKQINQILKKSVESLAEKDRMIYDLLYNQAFTPENTAQALGMTMPALYSRKHRIIQKIKKNMEDL